MKINPKIWFSKLAGFGQGLTIFFAAGILISVVVIFIYPEQVHYTPSSDTLIFTSKESLISLRNWNFINKALLLCASTFIYLAFVKLNRFASMIEQEIVISNEGGEALKRASVYLFIGLIIRPISLNLISGFDFLFSKGPRVTVLGGSQLFPLIIVIFICIFIYLIGILFIDMASIKQENDLTI